LAAATSFLTVAPARADSHHVHVVVEIPAGTSHKWEVTKPGGRLALERVDGRVRRIRYLPYPANYGFVPQTRSDPASGGDGDPLDVVLLGDAAPCGSVHCARVVGVLRLVDDGERDDKILAVAAGSAFDGVTNVDALRADFPGVVDILETWFTRYEGVGNRSDGVAGAAEARRIVDDAIDAFGVDASERR
jgi:inorganic pyrophosphatase